MKKMWAVSVGLILALAQAPAFAQAPDASGGPGAGGGPGRGGRHFQQMANYLGLSDEQQATWKSLYAQHSANMKPLFQEGKQLRQQLQSAVNAPNPDPAQVGAATLALKGHRDKLKAEHDAFESQLTSTLSLDQKTKYEAYKAAGKGGRGGWGRGVGRGFHGSPSSSSSSTTQG